MFLSLNESPIFLNAQNQFYHNLIIQILSKLFSLSIRNLIIYSITFF